MAIVRRDPFAREELHRRLVQAAGRTCDWCGGTRTVNLRGKWLHEYTVESDGGRVARVRGVFCGLSCMEEYHA
jgi:hypothetical protein